MELELEYQPPGPVARQFLESNAFVRGIRGPFGSGKSTVCCVDILSRAFEQKPGPDGKRRTRWAIIRNSYPELKTTTIKTWHGIVPPNFGRWIDSGPPTHHLQTDDVDCEVMFLALDSQADVKKLLSMDLTGAWINEAREIPKSVLDGLTARVGRYPAAASGGPSWFGILMDTNPPDTEHWWHKLAEEDRPQEFEFFAQPSGLSAEAENANNLPDKYYERMCLGKTEDWIKIYVHGEYGFVMDGRPIYPEYFDSVHSSKEPLQPLSGPAVVGLDFGLTPAATFHQRLATGRIITFHELVADDMGITRFADLLAPAMSQFPQVTNWDVVGDPAGAQRAGTDERTVFQVLIAKGINARPARTNDFILRRDAVGNLMSKLVDGKPALQISQTCTRLRKALAGGYCFKRLQVSGERFRDVPDKDMHSHVAESQQYALIEMGENPKMLKTGAQFPGVIHPQNKWPVFGARR